jgi:hypothetical protein
MANAAKKHTMSANYTRTDEEKQVIAFTVALTIWKRNKDAVKTVIAASRKAGDMITHRFLKQYANTTERKKEVDLFTLFFDKQRLRAEVFTQNIASVYLDLDRMMERLDENMERGEMDEQFYLSQADALKELYECKQRFNERIGGWQRFNE